MSDRSEYKLVVEDGELKVQLTSQTRVSESELKYTFLQQELETANRRYDAEVAANKSLTRRNQELFNANEALRAEKVQGQGHYRSKLYVETLQEKLRKAEERAAELEELIDTTNALYRDQDETVKELTRQLNEANSRLERIRITVLT